MPDHMDRNRLHQQVRSALLHLDDPVYLESHPLAQRLFPAAQAPGPSRGQMLRRALRAAIDTLNPGPSTPDSAPAARCYQVLHRYAIGGHSIIRIASDLDISERQAYRALRHATEAVARVLLPEEGARAAQGAPCAPEPDGAPLPEALDQISVGVEDEVDVAGLVRGVVETARALAQSRGMQVLFSPGDAETVCVTANRVMLRQALLSLASHIISSHAGDTVAVQLYRCEGGVCVQFAYHPAPSASSPQPGCPRATAEQLLGMLGLRCCWDEGDDDTARVTVSLPLAKEPTVLIVDDNEGLAQLFRRYLQRQPYHVHVAHSYAQALETMEHVQPDVMILDVLMPDRDGWEVLQTLRAREAAVKTRFIVCSIINDPQLATALGAHAFLRKPVSREQLLQTVEAVLSSPA